MIVFLSCRTRHRAEVSRYPSRLCLALHLVEDFGSMPNPLLEIVALDDDVDSDSSVPQKKDMHLI